MFLFDKGDPVVEVDDTVVPEWKSMPRRTMLRLFADYAENGEEIDYTYKLDENEKYQDLIKEYGLDEITAGKEDFELMKAILGFVCDNFKHNGNSYMPSERNAHAIINYCKEHDNKINCRGLAILTAELCRAYGLRARHITCFPYEAPFTDCHVVTHAYSDKLGKWIMMDPTQRLYLKNWEGVPVSLPELREILIGGGELVTNEDANYPGNPINLEDYREYMSKNTFMFQRGIETHYGSEDWRGGKLYRCKILVPVKYLELLDKYEDDKKESFTTCARTFWSV